MWTRVKGNVLVWFTFSACGINRNGAIDQALNASGGYLLPKQ